MLIERIAIGAAAALWAALVPGVAPDCLDHRWELPSRWLRRRVRVAQDELGGAMASAEAGRVSS